MLEASFSYGFVFRFKTTFKNQFYVVMFVCCTQVVESSKQRYRSTIWGPTCDSIDKIIDNCWIPELYVGDWLLFDNMGAYSVSLASDFNGFERAHIYCVATDELRNTLNLF